MKNLIIIPPNFAIGDAISVIGLIYYSLNHYNKVYYHLGGQQFLISYFSDYFINDPLFNNRIFITSQPDVLINNGEYGEYHVCNTLTGDWLSAKNDFSELKNIDKEYYFNDANPIYNKLDVPEKYKCSTNKHLPNRSFEINHIFYYELIGLNNNIRMDYFNYERNLTLENEYKLSILNRFGLNESDKYNIVNDPINRVNELKQHINNDYQIINIHFLAPSPGCLISLLEGAETIHFIEGCNVNFFYHCQYKKLFNYDKKIHFHIWARNRNWPDNNMHLDFAWKMMTFPKIYNWEFIFDKEQLKIS
jgi:hypothetical protein